MNSIFVSIANYRDPETLNTVRELVNHASGQHALSLTVLSQCRAGEFPEVYRLATPPWVKIEHTCVQSEESEGACWARAKIQESYAGETYYLQLDSHVRLVENWDVLLAGQHSLVAQAGSRAVLTAYLPGYQFCDGQRVVRHQGPTEFIVEQRHGIPSARSKLVPSGSRPTRTWFFAAGFAFTSGEFVRTVPYDREVFFLGEEISMAIRAYTAGYELYTPATYVGSHLYRRTQPDGGARSLIWDAADDVQREIRWYERDSTSKIKVAALCRGEWFGQYGIRNKARYRAFRDALLEKFQVDLSRCKATFAKSEPARAVRGDRMKIATPRRGQLTITGVGVEAISQMTLQAIAAIEAADIVFYNTANPTLAAKISQLNPNSRNLYGLYGEGKARRTTYVQMAETMLREVRSGKNVVGAFHGHPGFFVSSARRAMAIARIEGHEAKMLPGISSLDTLCSDLGIDPGTFGLQVLKASSVLKRDVVIAIDAHVVIVQIGAVGDPGFSFSGFKRTRTADFFDRMIRTYGEHQEAVSYKAAVLPGFPPNIVVGRLVEFRDTDLRDHLHGTTLYVPPKGVRFYEMKRRQTFTGGSLYSKADIAAIKEMQQPQEGFIGRSVSPAVLTALETLTRDACLLDQFRRDPAGVAAAFSGIRPDEVEAFGRRDPRLFKQLDANKHAETREEPTNGCPPPAPT